MKTENLFMVTVKMDLKTIRTKHVPKLLFNFNRKIFVKNKIKLSIHLITLGIIFCSRVKGMEVPIKGTIKNSP